MPSAPVIVGIVSVGLIFVGLGVLAWRWRARIRHFARTNRQFKGSYEKYGVGRGIESSHSSGSHNSKSSKKDPYGSFVDVETEKPKKALLLNFGGANRRSTESTTATSHSHSHSHSNHGFGGWGNSLTKQVYNGGGDSYTQKTAPSHPPGLGHPPSHGRRKSSRSSFSFSLRKSDSVKRPLKVQHLPNVSSIKSKGISSPMIVANGGPEPWSPLPSSTGAGYPSIDSGVHGGLHSDEATASGDFVSSIQSTPVHPPLVTFTPPKTPQKKFKQPQPRSPPATPGTSQKQDTSNRVRGGDYEDDSGLTLPLPPPTLISSDGSLYSRNSFCSSDHGHGHAQVSSPVTVTPAVPPLLGLGEGFLGTTGTSSVNSTSRPVKATQQSPTYTFSAPIYSDGDTLTRGRPSSLSSPCSPTSPSPFSPLSPSSPSSSPSHAQHCLPRLMTVIAPFTPTLEDELPLKVGDTVRIIEEYKDQWCLVQMVGRMDSPRGVVPCVCLQERKRIVPVPVNVGGGHY
ncbi:hypothetical protein NMY22_g10619 [Coprinellus aureogranulatus]|nr:hypothetical protein NMY22_g10619 [Coprinellus aureogranulatus]